MAANTSGRAKGDISILIGLRPDLHDINNKSLFVCNVESLQQQPTISYQLDAIST